MASLSLVTGPTLEPVTLAEAQEHCRVDSRAEDAFLTRAIQTAREYVESVTNRALITQTWDWTLDRFPCATSFEVPRPNLLSVTSISYMDTDGATQTWASTNYRVGVRAGPKAQPGRIELAYQQSYPLTRSVIDAVTIRFIAGYHATAATAVTNCPAALKSAILLLVGEMYERRTEVIVGTISTPNVLRAASLMAPYVVRRW